MLRKIISLFIVGSLSLFAQSLPLDFSLVSGKNKISKVSAATPASNTIEQILVDDNGAIWLATSRGLSKSTNNGADWTNYYKSDDFSTRAVSKVGYHNGTIWAGLWHNEEGIGGETVAVGDGLRYSTDDGNTWNEIPQPVDDPSDDKITYGINVLDALPVTVPQQNLVYDIDFTSDAVWIATFAGGLRKSTDMGQTWQRVVLPPDYLDEISPDDTLNFDLSPVAGELGLEENFNHRVFSILVVNDSLMYVGTSGGINKSTDGGVSWRKFNHQNQDQPISGNFIVELGYDESSNTVWAATWKAVDLAEYWAVSSSSDGGETWQTYLPDSRAHDFSFKYTYSGSNKTDSEILIASEEGTFRSSNGGNTWIVNPTPIDSQTGVALPSTKYRAVTANYLTDQTTDIWLGTLDGLAKINETQYGFWYGDWTVYIAAQELASDVESYAFPNPFSPDEERVTILYSTGGKDADVTIRIFDFGMNLVRTVIQNAPRIGGGEQQDIWDGRDENGSIVPNGVYFYRVDIGSNEPIYGKIMVLM